MSMFWSLYIYPAFRIRDFNKILKYSPFVGFFIRFYTANYPKSKPHFIY